MTTAEEKAALDKELMAQKLVQAEREAQASLREQRAAHEEDLQRLQREKVEAAGSGWVGLRATVSSVISGQSFFLLCLGLHLCEMELHLCSGDLGAAGRKHWGCFTKQTDSQAPILIQESTFICKKCCLHMKDHSRT